MLQREKQYTHWPEEQESLVTQVPVELSVTGLGWKVGKAGRDMTSGQKHIDLNIGTALDLCSRSWEKSLMFANTVCALRPGP